MRARIAACVVALAGSAVLGVPAGLIWSAVAPRALLLQISQGTALVVNAETSAFVAADGWFSAIAAISGVITGVLGYRLLVRRGGGAYVAACLVIGALAAALVMLWLGGQVGLSGYQHALATSRVGTRFNSSLTLGAKSALAFWPMLTAITIGMFELGTRTPEANGPDPSELSFGTPRD